MSWSDYFTYLTHEHRCENAVLVSNTDGAIFASTPNFTLSTYSTDIQDEDGSIHNIEVNEFANLLDAFNNQGTTTGAGGIRINREKYFVVIFDAERAVMYLRKKDGGACIARSNLIFMIGTFASSQKLSSGEPQNPITTNQVCESLQKLLRDANY